MRLASCVLGATPEGEPKPTDCGVKVPGVVREAWASEAEFLALVATFYVIIYSFFLLESYSGPIQSCVTQQVRHYLAFRPSQWLNCFYLLKNSSPKQSHISLTRSWCVSTR